MELLQCLAHLAADRRVSASKQTQAICRPGPGFRDTLKVQKPDIHVIGARHSKRISVVLRVEVVRRVGRDSRPFADNAGSSSRSDIRLRRSLPKAAGTSEFLSAARRLSHTLEPEMRTTS